MDSKCSVSISPNAFDDYLIDINSLLKTYFDNIIGSGQCGDAVYWRLNRRGELTITGSGPMYDYDHWRKPIYRKASSKGGCSSLYSDDDDYTFSVWEEVGELPPWWSFSGSILKINFEEGITYIGAQSFDFSYTVEINQIIIPNSVKEIGYKAFKTSAAKYVEASDQILSYILMNLGTFSAFGTLIGIKAKEECKNDLQRIFKRGNIFY